MDTMLRPLDEMREPALRRVLAWWEAHHTTERLPSRGDLDPTELNDVLPYIFLVEVVRGRPIDFRYRLVGNAVEAFAGVTLTGRTVRELPIEGDERHSILSQYGITLNRRQPTYCEHEFVVAEERFVRYRRLIAPLSSTPPLVDVLIGAIVFEVTYPV